MNVEDEISDAAERASALRVRAHREENGAVSNLEAAIAGELGVEPAKKLRGFVGIPANIDEGSERA